MPLHTWKEPTLYKSGAVIDIAISPSRSELEDMADSGILPPPPLAATAMFDTGARRTVIRRGLGASLGLTPIGFRTIGTADGRLECAVFSVSIVIPDLGPSFVGAVLEMALEGQNVDCLLGRDLLRHGLFVFNGPEGLFTFAL